MAVKKAHMILKGKVQGVFFRDFAKQTANKLGIVGYAKNLRNGDLEIVAQGEEAKLQEYIRLCKRGPIFAKVEDLRAEFSEVDPEDDFEYFDIRFS